MKCFEAHVFTGPSFAALALLALSACATPEQTARRGGELAQAMYPTILDASIARMIGAECRSLAHSNLAEEVHYRLAGSEQVKSGYRSADFEAAGDQIDEDRLENDLRRYIRENRITSRAAMCRAGQREIARNSDIGKMLEEV